MRGKVKLGHWEVAFDMEEKTCVVFYDSALADRGTIMKDKTIEEVLSNACFIVLEKNGIDVKQKEDKK